ncbi:HNH endonuclease signature motif containing protein [Nocardioides sp. YIM 152588]|uniref:HNH endonuclease signature motif containing protein n=1 Tax=Nocardioides sp. YIM 152588 TaxID=3158259 RepID=UPI0032E53068
MSPRRPNSFARPVLDLADHAPVEAYEIPDRHRRQVVLRDPTCRFPHCTRAAEHCDLDHRTPWQRGGATCPCNLTPLCRRHHRTKTHTRWRYQALDPGTYLWTSPSDRQWIVDPQGTRAIADHCPAGPAG